MKRLKVWVMIILSYIFTFVTPMVAAYFFLAIDKVSEMGRGGAVYYTIISVIGIIMVITLNKAVGEMEANLFKSIFKIALKVAIILGVLNFIRYIDFNTDKLFNFMYVSLGGVVIGSILEIIAVYLYGDYIREVGAF